MTLPITNAPQFCICEMGDAVAPCPLPMADGLENARDQRLPMVIQGIVGPSQIWGDAALQEGLVKGGVERSAHSLESLAHL